jgi:hypothetical protein
MKNARGEMQKIAGVNLDSTQREANLAHAAYRMKIKLPLMTLAGCAGETTSSQFTLVIWIAPFTGVLARFVVASAQAVHSIKAASAISVDLLNIITPSLSSRAFLAADEVSMRYSVLNEEWSFRSPAMHGAHRLWIIGFRQKVAY